MSKHYLRSICHIINYVSTATRGKRKQTKLVLIGKNPPHIYAPIKLSLVTLTTRGFLVALVLSYVYSTW
jgi:hypothetical protein